MVNIWKRLFIGLLVFIIICIPAFALAVDIFDQPGIHTLGPIVHIELSKKCYLFDGVTGETIGESVFFVDGYQFDRFTGCLYVQAYPLPANRMIGTSLHLNRKRALLVNMDPETMEIVYRVEILRGKENIIVASLIVEGKEITAVCGDTEEDALRNYETYIATMYRK